ncbi:MAG: FHA domain-containing protein [Myxococcales bacterium]|nr:FHA domain-containing protein [Myxococcales bacterium]
MAVERVRIEYHGGSIELPEGSTHVGRSVRCRIRFNDESVSREHLAIQIGEHVIVRDLGSTNGTSVNGSMISAETRVGDGDVVSAGNVWFRVRIEDGSEGEIETSPGLEPNVEEQPRVRRMMGAPMLQKLDAPVFERKTCPRCRAQVKESLGACDQCGFEWPAGRATANTLRLDLEALHKAHDERREHVRVPHRMPVIYDSETLTIEAGARDISLGGMFIACDLLDPPGTRCTVTVLPDGAPAIPLSGVVAHVRSQPGSKQPSGMGVRFDELSRISRMWLESVLMLPPSTPLFESDA